MRPSQKQNSHAKTYNFNTERKKRLNPHPQLPQYPNKATELGLPEGSYLRRPIWRAIAFSGAFDFTTRASRDLAAKPPPKGVHMGVAMEKIDGRR